MDPLLFARWTLLLLETAEKDSSSIEKISKLLQKCSFPEHKEIALLLLTFILDGKLKLKRVRKWGNDTQEAIELEESSRLPVSTFSHVEQIWNEKDEAIYRLLCCSNYDDWIRKIENVVVKTNGTEKKK